MEEMHLDHSIHFHEFIKVLNFLAIRDSTVSCQRVPQFQCTFMWKSNLCILHNMQVILNIASCSLVGAPHYLYCESEWIVSLIFILSTPSSFDRSLSHHSSHSSIPQWQILISVVPSNLYCQLVTSCCQSLCLC